MIVSHFEEKKLKRRFSEKRTFSSGVTETYFSKKLVLISFLPTILKTKITIMISPFYYSGLDTFLGRKIEFSKKLAVFKTPIVFQ